MRFVGPAIEVWDTRQRVPTEGRFLRSGEKDIRVFAESRRRRKWGKQTDPTAPSGMVANEIIKPQSEHLG